MISINAAISAMNPKTHRMAPRSLYPSCLYSRCASASCSRSAIFSLVSSLMRGSLNMISLLSDHASNDQPNRPDRNWGRNSKCKDQSPCWPSSFVLVLWQDTHRYFSFIDNRIVFKCQANSHNSEEELSLYSNAGRACPACGLGARLDGTPTRQTKA